MIEKILNIKYLGRFRNFSGSNDEVKFEKNTFIFGKNTYGKSTFSSIFNSIYKNNPNYIIGRKTFGISGNQEIKIKTDNDVIQFNSNKWDKSLKIKVFDSHYISENIYNNDYLDDDKQSKIASIILGEEGKQKEKNYVEAKSDCDKNSIRKSEITRTYNSSFDKNILLFDDFKKLSGFKVEDLELEKEEKNKILNSYTNQENIKNIIGNIKKSLNVSDLIDISLIKDNLEINGGIISKHIEENIKDSKLATSYLATGVSLLNGDNCSFCGQKLDTNALNLIDELNKFFSENYKNLNSNVKKINSEFAENNIESNILKYKSGLLKYGIDIDTENFITDIKTQITIFKQELKSKSDNLNYEVNFDSFNQLKKICDKFYNENFSKLESKYSTKIDELEIKKIKSELKIIEIKLDRLKDYWDKLCVEYTTLEKTYIETLKPLEEKTFDEKKEYAKKVLQDYEEGINKILDKLNASFRLTNFSVPETRRGQLNLFSLKFLDHSEAVPLDGTERELNLKNTLSESDKRLLAFAFFITDIKKIKSLDEYIIVFDDPMSSLDSNRKLATIELIRDNIINEDNKTYNQIIILTHEENFFKFLDDKFRDNKKLLRISYSKTDKNSSIIPCNIEEEFFKEEHFKRIEKYQKHLENDDFSNCDLGDVRKILEHIIDRKYYITIDKEKRKKGGIIKWYYDKKSGDTVIQGKILDIYPNMSHHDQPQLKDGDFEDGDKRNVIRNLFELTELI